MSTGKETGEFKLKDEDCVFDIAVAAASTPKESTITPITIALIDILVFMFLCPI
jgi:hypothetical protein